DRGAADPIRHRSDETLDTAPESARGAGGVVAGDRGLSAMRRRRARTDSSDVPQEPRVRVGRGIAVSAGLRGTDAIASRALLDPRSVSGLPRRAAVAPRSAQVALLRRGPR